VTAVDACALAAARSIGKGQSEMNRIVDLMFDSNFPPHLLLSTDRGHSAPTITAIPGEGRREVSLTGYTVVPMVFMRMFGWDTLRLEASAQAARRDVNVMLILDRSGSMVLAPGPPWPQLQDAARFFVNQFDTTADRLGLITFGTSARVDYGVNYSPGVDFKTAITGMITSQQSYAQNRTNPTEALYLAYKALNTLNDSTALNVIVFFTDGQPTAFSNWFNVRTSGTPRSTAGSPRYGVVYTDQGLSNIQGLWRPFATTLPANEGGGDDVVQLASTVTGNSGEDVETLLAPTATGGLRHYRPEGASVSSPQFRLDLGPNTVDMSGATLVNGSASARGREIADMGENASLQIAKLARDTATLGEGIRIYGIGLGGYGGPADHEFMKGLANAPGSNPHYDDQPEGIYYYAPGPSQLRQAFQTVASEIFRLIR
jgi:hypothetical protein